MSDSCGMLFVSTPGVYTLSTGLDDLHDRDLTGVLARGLPLSEDDPTEPAVAETRKDYDRIEKDGGQGMPLETYLPKAEQDLKAKLSSSMTPHRRLRPQLRPQSRGATGLLA